MKKRNYLFFLFQISALAWGMAQSADVREEVFLHLNGTSFISGETINYAVYNRSAATGRFSDLSQIVYVELIGKNQKPVFQQKISLANGQGAGSFFIPSLVSTGTYQLLAYTRWMKNFGDYFEASITIVNPFENYEAPDTTDFAPQVLFFPEGGHLVAGQANTVVVETRHFKKGKLSAKVVGATGEVVKMAALNANGLDRIDFIPKESAAYQLILEDESGDFHFFTLPAASPAELTLHVETIPSGYMVTPVGNAGHGALSVRLRDAQNEWLNQPVTLNQSFSLSYDKLPKGVVLMQLLEQGTVRASRMLVSPDGTKPFTSLQLSAADYQPRTVVTFPLEVNEDAEVSVSVRLKTPEHQVPSVQQDWLSSLEKPLYPLLTNVKSVRDYDNLLIVSTPKWADDELEQSVVELLPELRGQLIAGQIDGGDTVEVGNQIISYAIVGEQYQVQMARTDVLGRFVFQLEPFEGERTAVVGMMEHPEAYSITMENAFLKHYPAFDYSPVILDSAMATRLASRSVKNQIENAYFEVHPDSVFKPHSWLPQFSNSLDYFYILDDYNRFPEMYEHFIEYIPSVVARKNKHRSKIKVMVPYSQNTKDPLLLLDGVPVSAENILDFSPYKIKSIGVINGRMFLGPLVADGLVSFHTFENNLQEFDLPANTLLTTYQGVEPRKQSRLPDYLVDGEKNARIPDYRTQLFWDAGVNLVAGQPREISFFTSDFEGTYEIIVEGYTHAGTPVIYKGEFEVRDLPE